MSEREKLQQCSDLVVNGINCLAWEHKLPKPFFNTTNTSGLVKAIDSTGLPALVSMDSLRLADINIWFALNGVENAYNTDVVQILENSAQRGHVLLMGDFESSYEQNLSDNINRRNAIWALAGSGLVALLASRDRKRGMTRRQFLKGLAWGAAAFATADLAMAFTGDNTTDAINNCQLDNITNQVSGLLNGSARPDLEIRTGLVLAKQSRMRDSGFLSGYSNNPNFSVWGTSHLLDEGMLEGIRQVVDNPHLYIQGVFEREVKFLQEEGVSISEALDRSAELKVNMAGLLPLTVKKIGNAYEVLPVIQGDNPIFFDDRMLGFNSQQLSYRQVVGKVKQQSLDVWLS